MGNLMVSGTNVIFTVQKIVLHSCCEACRNQHAQNLKNGFKAVAGVAGTVACIVVTVATAGKINPKK